MNFVGRRREMNRLSSALDDAENGCSAVVVLAGEPGIGKSRMAEELAAAAEARGVRALSGRSYEAEGTPPLWTWIQALRDISSPGTEDIDPLTRLDHPAAFEGVLGTARKP